MFDAARRSPVLLSDAAVRAVCEKRHWVGACSSFSPRAAHGCRAAEASRAAQGRVEASVAATAAAAQQAHLWATPVRCTMPAMLWLTAQRAARSAVYSPQTILRYIPRGKYLSACAGAHEMILWALVLLAGGRALMLHAACLFVACGACAMRWACVMRYAL